MDRRVLGVGLVLAVGVLGGLGALLLFPTAADVPAVEPVQAEEPAPVVTPDDGRPATGTARTADPEDLDPDSPEARRRAIAARRGQAAEEWPRGSAIRPEDRPEGASGEWAELREEQAQALMTEQVGGAEQWVADQGLSREEGAEVVDAVRDLHNEVHMIRTAVEMGEQSPAWLRDRMAKARADTVERVQDVVGPEQTADLREHLATVSRGGGF